MGVAAGKIHEEKQKISARREKEHQKAQEVEVARLRAEQERASQEHAAARMYVSS